MEWLDLWNMAIGFIGCGFAGYFWGKYHSHRKAVRALLWILHRHSTDGGNLRFNTFERAIIKEAVSLVK